MWEVENYVEDDENYFAIKVYSIVDKVSTEKDRDAAALEHKVYSVVDKVSYLNGQTQKLMEHLMPERCDGIQDVGTLTEAIESTSVDVACRS